MGRLYRPSSSSPEESPVTTPVVTGRLYRPSSGVAHEDGEKVPARSASKAEWVDYAKSKGASDSVSSLTRAAIIEEYAPRDDESTQDGAPVDSAAETTQEQPIEAAKDISVASGALDGDVSGEGEDPFLEGNSATPIEDAEEQAGPPGANQPKANASLGEWQTFARSQGATDEELEGQGRNDLRDRYSLL